MWTCFPTLESHSTDCVRLGGVVLFWFWIFLYTTEFYWLVSRVFIYVLEWDYATAFLCSSPVLVKFELTQVSMSHKMSSSSPIMLCALLNVQSDRLNLLIKCVIFFMPLSLCLWSLCLAGPLQFSFFSSFKWSFETGWNILLYEVISITPEVPFSLFWSQLIL